MNFLIQIFNIITRCGFRISDNSIKFELPDDVDAQSFKDLLTGAGYSVDDAKTVRSSSVTIKLTAPDWGGGVPFFMTFEALLQSVLQKGEVPEHYYVLDEKKSSDEARNESLLLQLCLDARSLLARLADHSEPKEGVSAGQDKLLYFIKHDGDVRRFEFRPTITWAVLISIPNAVESINVVNELGRCISVGDLQDIERKSVMHSALGGELLKNPRADDAFAYIVKHLSEFQSKYKEHHQLFIRQFSVNKILEEISTHNLQYVSKINEIISNAQTKALTIPAALIAVGAVMNIKSWVEGVVIGLGLVLSTLVVWRSLGVHTKTFTNIRTQVTTFFEKYELLDEESEVSQRARDVKDELHGLVRDSKKSVLFVKCILITAVISSIAYIGWSSFVASTKGAAACEDIAVTLKQEDIVIVAVGSLNLRGGPGLLNNIEMVLSAGTVLNVQDNSNSEWLSVKVRAVDQQGWVNKKYVKSIADGDLVGTVSICK